MWEASWTRDQMLLATAVDVLAAGNWQRANAGLKKGQQPTPRPKPINRPGIEPPGERRIGRAAPVKTIRARLSALGHRRR